MLHTFTAFFQILDSADIFLTDAQAQCATDAGRANLILYQYLAEDSFNRHEYMWKLRPKLHCFMHIIEGLSETHENPCKCDAFAWEDFVGRVKKMQGKLIDCRQRSELPKDGCSFLLSVGTDAETFKHYYHYYYFYLYFYYYY